MDRVSRDRGPKTAGTPALRPHTEIAAVLCVVVLPALAFAIAPFLEGKAWSLTSITDSVTFSAQSAAWIAMVLFVVHRSGEGFTRFGLAPRVHLLDLVTIVLLLVAAWAATFATYDVASYLIDGLEDEPLATGYPYFPYPETAFEIGLALFALLVGAAAEEIVFRGYLITRLEQVFGVSWRAVVVSAAIFASYHVYQGLLGLLNVFVWGLVYGVAYLGLRRVWPLVLAHFASNAVSSVPGDVGIAVLLVGLPVGIVALWAVRLIQRPAR